MPDAQSPFTAHPSPTPAKHVPLAPQASEQQTLLWSHDPPVPVQQREATHRFIWVNRYPVRSAAPIHSQL
jgi:hypothetical protein